MKKERIGLFAIMGTTIIWGSSFILMKNTLDSMLVMYLLAIRFTLAAVIMGLTCIKDIRKMEKKTLKAGVIMGIFLFLSYAFQTYGLALTTPGRNAFLTAVYCVLVPFMSWGFTKKRPDKYNLLAACFCIVGVALISLTDGLKMGLGEGLTLVCGVMFGLHMIATEAGTKHSGVQVLSFLQFATVGIISWVGALMFEEFPQSVPTNAVLCMAYLTVFCTAVCFFLQTFGQKLLPSSQAAIIMTFESVFGALFSVIFYKEVITARVGIGMAAMFLAVIISETKLSFLKKHKNPS